MKHVPVVVVLLVSVLLCSCGKDHEGLISGLDYEPLPAPTDLEVTPGSEPLSLTLTWSFPPEHLGALKEFRIYYYYEPYDMVEFIDVTSSASYTNTRLIVNVEYCYKVSAVDTAGLEGWRTTAVCEYASGLTQ